MDETNTLNRYFEAIEKRGLYSSRRNLQFYLDHVFQTMDFTGKAMLDIGAGMGLCSFYAAARGASRVVSLEPEAAGSTEGFIRTFQELSQILDLPQVELKPITFQEYDPGDTKFDIVFLQDSVNHIEQEACETLLTDPRSAQVYLQLFKRMYDLCAPGGTLIITDVSRYNFWPMIGLRNPFAPTIGWKGHQSPEHWAKLLSQVGFQSPMIRWKSLNRFGRLGSVLLGNKLGAFFVHSYFSLTMRKPSAGDESGGS